MSDVTLRGLVLKSKPYQETDLMVWVFLQNNELKHFIYKGYFKAKSKRINKASEFVEYEFRFKDKDGLISPIEITSNQIFENILEDIQFVSLGQVINSIYMLYHEQLNYEDYHFFIHHLHENPHLILSLCLVNTLNLLGFAPYVDGDVLSGNRQINHFDITEGGFVYRKSAKSFNTGQLKQIRTLFKAKPSNYSIISNAQVDMKVLNLLVEYFEYHTGTKLITYDFYKQLL